MKWLKKVADTPLTSIARVIDSLEEITNNRTNAPSIHAVNEAIKNNWLTIYPIGSIYMSVNEVNPSEIFGGTWQRIKDRFLLASGDTYNNGATGGEATHTLTVNELPSHNHSLNIPTAVAGSSANIASGSVYSIQEATYTNPTGNTGGGAAHNNMPPYLAVNVWVRTA